MFPSKSQKRDHEIVKVPVQYRLDVARLVAASQVLDELVRGEHIGPDLAPPGDVAQGPRKRLELLSALFALALGEFLKRQRREEMLLRLNEVYANGVDPAEKRLVAGIKPKLRPAVKERW